VLLFDNSRSCSRRIIHICLNMLHRLRCIALTYSACASIVAELCLPIAAAFSDTIARQPVFELRQHSAIFSFIDSLPSGSESGMAASVYGTATARRDIDSLLPVGLVVVPNLRAPVTQRLFGYFQDVG
jgi:hypothetical protein